MNFGALGRAFGREGASVNGGNIQSVRTPLNPLSYRTDSNPNTVGQWFVLNAVNGNESNINPSSNASERWLELKQNGASGGASAGFKSAYWNCWRVLATSVPSIRSYFDLEYTVLQRSTTGNGIKFMLEYGDTNGTPATYRSIRLDDSVGTHTVSFFNDLKTTLSLRLQFDDGTQSGINTGVSTIRFNNLTLTKKYRENG